ncbi:hypothetical protein [Celerinatantimonas yamalensis]|uniref:Uncharacterized protein n=1 Tax=Celerinatantimonas yamalensis TaxID=559956 RepID=A0ABW9G713_9GAMM
MNIKKLTLPLIVMAAAMSLAACNDDKADQPQSSTTAPSGQMNSTQDNSQNTVAPSSDSTTNGGANSTPMDSTNGSAPATSN